MFEHPTYAVLTIGTVAAEAQAPIAIRQMHGASLRIGYMQRTIDLINLDYSAIGNSVVLSRESRRLVTDSLVDLGLSALEARLESNVYIYRSIQRQFLK